MSNSTNTTDTPSVQDNHLKTEFFLPTIIVIVTSIFGQFGNASIVWATYKNRNLQNRCNILIALNAAVDLVHQYGHYIFAYYLFTGINYTTTITCWFLQEPPYIAFLVGMIFILLVGVDRVISVLMPIMITMCNIGYGHGPQMQTVATYVGYIIEALMVIVYGIMWISFACRKNQSSISKQVIKSLSVILLIILICWPCGTIIFPLIFPNIFGFNEDLPVEYTAILINFGVASNYHIYFIFSRDYRAAFKRQLSFLPCFRNAEKVQQQVQVISVVGSSVKTNNQTRIKK